MREKVIKKKLKLDKQTIQNLTPVEGKEVKGGWGYPTIRMITCLILPGTACIPETAKSPAGPCQ